MAGTSGPLMKIKIDSSRCGGHARCLEEVPEVFGYDDRTNVAFIIKGADVITHREAIDRAILACPEKAISWSTEDEQGKDPQGADKS